MEVVLDRVCYEYPGGIRALDDLDLVVRSGESLAIIGANGSGKTTLARHLVGLLRPTHGRVLVGGEDASTRRVAELAARVGICFAEPDRQIFSRDVRGEVAFGPRQLGFSASRTARAVDRALAAVGLADAADAHPHDLGEARRKLLAIASVLAMETPVLVLDEPTSGLDARGKGLIDSLVRTLHDEGRTVIVISHDLPFVAESAGRIALLSAGRVELEGSPAQVFAEAAWERLHGAHLDPPPEAILGARLGLGATPTQASLLQAWHARGALPEAEAEGSRLDSDGAATDDATGASDEP